MGKDNKKINNTVQFFKGIALATALTASLVITQSIYTVNTFAAAVEDCDLDGYDDHTGNPVPWIGFDSTKGEEIPAGWDGHTIYKSKKAFQDAQKKDDEKSDSSGSGSSSGSSSSSSGSSGGSSSGSSSSSSSSSSGSSSGSGSTGSSSSGGSSSKSNTTKKSTSKSSSSKSSSSKKSSSKKTTDSSKSSQTNKKEESNVTEVNEEVASEATTEEVTSAADEKNTEKKKSKKKKTKKEETTTEPESTVEELEEIIQPDIQTVISTGGTLEVNEEDGSIIHAGSNLLIKGTGFVGNVNDIVIEIHSDNAINLGNVSTAEDGSFEAKVYIPDDLEEGQHEVVIKYLGQEIATQTIKVGPKVADTFLAALTVGFSSQNKGLIPGLLILAGLAIAGIATLFFGGLFTKKGKD